MKTKSTAKSLKRPSRKDWIEIPSVDISPEKAITELAQTIFEVGAATSKKQIAHDSEVPPAYLKALASIATNAWRAKTKMLDVTTGGVREDMKRVDRHIEAIYRNLAEVGIVIRDHTGDVYDEGQPMKVIASKPTPRLDKKRVSETLLPSIFWNNRLIQNGEIEITAPLAPNVALNLESFMESKGLTETERQLLHEQAKHSVSCYGVNGEHLKNDFDKEDLLAVIMQMERYMIDSNVAWEGEVIKPANRNKAFIIGGTIADEKENLESVLFSKKVDISNNNIFGFGMNNLKGKPYLMIDRFDEYYRKIFDEGKLRQESRPRATRADMEFLEMEREHMANVLDLKQRILAILNLPDVANLPSVDETERKKTKIIQSVRSKAPSCFKDYWKAVEVASYCYAALLLERDEVGKKTRNEFSDQKRNVFGDTLLVQNALWLNSRILSNDKAVGRIVEYLALPEIKMTGLV